MAWQLSKSEAKAFCFTDYLPAIYFFKSVLQFSFHKLNDYKKNYNITNNSFVGKDLCCFIH